VTKSVYRNLFGYERVSRSARANKEGRTYLDKKIVQQISERMREKTTEELRQILNENDKFQWSDEAFEAIRQILSKRNESIAKVQDMEKQRNIEGLIGVITASNLAAYSDDERKNAAIALGRLRAVEAVEPLSKIINNSLMPFSMRSNAISALGEIGSPQAVNQLIVALDDPIGSIRSEALKTLEKIDDPKAKEATEIEVCQICKKGFPHGSGGRSLCRSCAESKGKVVEICLPNGEVKEYEKMEILRDEILSGNLKKDCKARIKRRKETKWATIEKISNTDFKLQSLYKPVWAYTKKFLGYGVIGGIILKTLDTTWLFFQIDKTGSLGFIWLLVVASLFVSKWWKWAPLVAIFISIKSGIKGNLFTAVLSVTFVGAIFGGPAGMISGTIVGLFKQKRTIKAPDAGREGAKPYLVGLLVPLIFLGMAIPLYIFWLTPLLFDWLSKRP
jgi:hypothetical protein